MNPRPGRLAMPLTWGITFKGLYTYVALNLAALYKTVAEGFMATIFIAHACTLEY